jgi:hypothetical protein
MPQPARQRPTGRPVRGAPDRGRRPGLALIRDGNGPRICDTLLRYRGAAMAEFWRALRTLEALQAEQAALREPAAGADLELSAQQPAAPVSHAPMTDRAYQPGPHPNAGMGPGNAAPALACPMPNEPEPRRVLHQAAARSQPHEPAAEHRTNPNRRPDLRRTPLRTSAPRPAERTRRDPG